MQICNQILSNTVNQEFTNQTFEIFGIKEGNGMIMN